MRADVEAAGDVPLGFTLLVALGATAVVLAVVGLPCVVVLLL